MWQSWEEFAEALEGRFGEEEQTAALTFAQDSGMLEQWAADEEAEISGSYDDALEQEFQRLETQIGRKLTQGEEQAMLDSLSTQNQDEMFVPDFVAEYGPQLASARNHEDGRVHLAAEAAQEVFDQQAAEQHQPSFGPPEPAGGAGRFGDGADGSE